MDRVASVEDLPFPDASFGTVLAFSTFEHVRRFWVGFEEVFRVLRPDGVLLTDCSRGAGMSVNGQRTASAQVVPGDHVQVGSFKFEFSNPGFAPRAPLARPGSFLDRLFRLPLAVRVGLIAFAVAATLYALLATTYNPNLVPVTLLAMSAVVPAAMMCYLVEKYDTTGISFFSLAVTFLAGGTVGVIAAVIYALPPCIWVTSDMTCRAFSGACTSSHSLKRPLSSSGRRRRT